MKKEIDFYIFTIEQTEILRKPSFLSSEIQMKIAFPFSVVTFKSRPANFFFLCLCLHVFI